MPVRENIFGTTRAISTIFVHVAYGRGSVLLRQGDEIFQGNRTIFGVFFPTDNALYSIGREVMVGLHTAGEV